MLVVVLSPQTICTPGGGEGTAADVAQRPDRSDGYLTVASTGAGDDTADDTGDEAADEAGGGAGGGHAQAGTAQPSAAARKKANKKAKLRKHGYARPAPRGATRPTMPGKPRVNFPAGGLA